MRILIIGAGVVGRNLAKELSREGHDVALVEKNPATARRCSESMDVLVVPGSGTSEKVLKQAGIAESEMVVAVTNSDEVNLVCCMFAREFGVKRKVARIRNPEYADGESKISLPNLGVDLAVNPEHVIVRTVQEMISTPGATDAAEFGDGKILLRGFRVPRGAPIAWKKLSELRDASTLDSFLIVAISRGNRLIIPRGEDEIRALDNLVLFVLNEVIDQVLALAGRD